jgi:hypothetical protein
MAQGIHNLTVQEAQNVQLGQCRSAYLDDGGAYTTRAGEVVIAIQVIQDIKLEDLIAEDPANCFNSATASGNSGGTGDDIIDTTLFPSGIVIYGRWTQVHLVSGVAVLYMGR